MTKDTDALREAVVGNTAIEKIAILSNKDWPLARVNPDATLDMIHEIAVEAIYPTAPTALATPASDVADPDFREYVRKAGERLAPHSGDAPGTPTRDALVWINAALHPVARASVPLDCPIAPNVPASDVAPVAWFGPIPHSGRQKPEWLPDEAIVMIAFNPRDCQTAMTWGFAAKRKAPAKDRDWENATAFCVEIPLAQSVDPAGGEDLREALKDLARGVFIDAATITHHSWVDGTNGREPDFDEYAGDYAESFADAYVDNITAALATPASDVAPVGDDERAAFIRLLDAADRFNGVYSCSDRVAGPYQGQMILAVKNAYRVLGIGRTKPHPPAHPVDHVAGEALREGPAPIPNTRLQCFGCKHLETEDWREPSGDGETFDRGTYARCKAMPTEEGGQSKSIGVYWSRTNDAPKWCPFLAALKGPAA